MEIHSWPDSAHIYACQKKVWNFVCKCATLCCLIIIIILIIAFNLVSLEGLLFSLSNIVPFVRIMHIPLRQLRHTGNFIFYLSNNMRNDPYKGNNIGKGNEEALQCESGCVLCRNA